MARLYTVPNWGYCGEPGQGANGPIDGTDRMLAALIDWGEKGKVPITHRGEDRVQYIFGGKTPSAINASPNSAGYIPPPPQGPPRDYAICPFPLVSVFDKSKANIPGAVYQAENWSCQRKRR